MNGLVGLVEDGNDVVVRDDLQQIRRVAAAGPLDVIHVDGAVPPSAAIVSSQKPNSLIESVCRCTAKSLRSAATSDLVDHRRRGAEILVHLDRAAARRDRFLDRLRIGAAAAEQGVVERRKFGGLQEAGQSWSSLPLPTSNTGPALSPISVVVPPASACSDCSGDWRCAWHSIAPAVTMKPAPEIGDVVLAHDQVGMHARHDVGIAGLADADDASVANADVGLDDARDRIDDRGVLDDDVEMPVGGLPIAVDALAVAQVLAGADQQFVAVHGEIMLDLGEQLGVAEPHQVALGGTVEFGIGAPRDGDHELSSGAEIAARAGQREPAVARARRVERSLDEPRLAAHDAVAGDRQPAAPI